MKQRFSYIEMVLPLLLTKSYSRVARPRISTARPSYSRLQRHGDSMLICERKVNPFRRIVPFDLLMISSF